MRTLALTIGSMMMMPAAALAQQAQPAPSTAPAAAAAPTVGATIYDSAGVSLGTVASITPQAVILNTGTAQVPVPPTSIGKTDKGFAMAMTKADLDAAVAASQAQAQAAVKAKLTPGAAVSGLNGTALGTIKAADAQFVTVTTAKGDVKLPIAGFSTDAGGKIVAGITAEQLAAATPSANVTAAGGATTGANTGAAATSVDGTATAKTAAGDAKPTKAKGKSAKTKTTATK